MCYFRILVKEYYIFAIEIAEKAGEILLDLYPKIHEIRYKGSINLVTEADVKSENLLKQAIKEKYPAHTILAEESGLEDRDKTFKWIIDPLDGTTNFAHGFPWFCVSVALEVNKEICLGVVHNPISKETFSVLKQNGAFLNGMPIRVSKAKQIEKALLATGFPYNIHEQPEPVVSRFNKMLKVARGIRRAGSAALDLCYVACGRFDGFWEERLYPWDTAAGLLLVKEAGGIVTDFKGNPYSIYGKEILATNGFLHKTMLEILNE